MGGLNQGSKRRYKMADKKSHPVPVLVSQEDGVYYDQERELVQRMREDIQNEPCRIDDETEKELIIGEPGFLTRQEEDLVKKLIHERHGAYAFNDNQRGRLDVDKIEMIRIHIVPHESWNVRGAKYHNPEDRRRVVEYLDGKIRTDVAGYFRGPYASPWFCFVKPNGVLRWVQDLQRLNAVTVRDAGGLPNADQLSEACAGRSIVFLIDLYSGCNQFPVYLADRPITAMHTPRGLVHMNITPQGWTNAVTMVQRSMIRVMQPISPQITEPYIDDLAVKGPIEKDESEVVPGVRRIMDEPLTIEAGVQQADEQVAMMGRMYYLRNTLLQVQREIVKTDEIVIEDNYEFDEEKEGEFEQEEISEEFKEEEYEGFYLEMGLLLSGDKKEREVSEKTLRMRDHYVVRGGHLFIRNKRGPPRRVVCGRNRQIDVVAALHDGIVGGHRSFAATYKKAMELYYWEGMFEMTRKYCESCVPCQIRSPIRYKEPLHPRYIKEVGAVVHLDLLAMPLGLGGYNYIFDARDNLTGFVDGRAIRNKTRTTLTDCIKEYYLRYPFVLEFTMNRGSKFTCGEVKELLKELGSQDLENNLTLEELLDLRARQISATEERVQKATMNVADSRGKDKERQDQTRKERLQEKGLWIGRAVAEPQGKEAENEEEDNVSLKRLKNKTRVSPKSSSKGSERDEGDEQEEEETAEERKRRMGASMVPRRKKLGKKRAIESGREEVQERRSEKGGGMKEAGEGKTIQEGGKAPKVKRTEEKRPNGDRGREETSEIRKKEDERDAQVEKLMRDMKEMKEEMKGLKKGKEELQKEVSQLRAALTMSDGKLENEAVTIGRMEIRMDDLGPEVSVLGLDLDNEISERKKLGQEWEKIWDEISVGMEGLRLNHQEKEKEATEMVERKKCEEKGIQTEEKRDEPPAPEKEVSENVAMALPGQGKRQRESQLDSPKEAEDQAEASIQPDIKKIKPSMVG
ncbi:hypothetical protein CBR_g6694 [Chara braunii]|uniref:Uncharacterized protein n=1 Tax=Chara braunii TaxID=69332 RepID=A0A388KKP2_CHABU|nr:hypothetical protein CBR_g6694 [Chara braunii]|eukprot:GBG70568.1 hypothetical protein CBR_g6694 [Chara braunii]